MRSVPFSPRRSAWRSTANSSFELQGKAHFLDARRRNPPFGLGLRFARRIIDLLWNRSLFRGIHPDVEWGLPVSDAAAASPGEKGNRAEEYLEAAWWDVLHSRDVCIHGHHHLSGIWMSRKEKSSPRAVLFSLGYVRMRDGGFENHRRDAAEKFRNKKASVQYGASSKLGTLIDPDAVPKPGAAVSARLVPQKRSTKSMFANLSIRVSTQHQCSTLPFPF